MSQTVTRATRIDAHKRVAAAALATLLGAAVFIVAPISARAAQACGSSAGYSLCLSAPDGVLSGDETISVTVSGSTSGITELKFSWGSGSTNSNHLFSDFEAPYTFVWRTDRYLDATQWLNVRVERNSDTLGTPVALQLTVENGNDTSVPQNPADWPSVFQPRPYAGDPVVAAVGDAGDGTARDRVVSASVAASQASVLLYLGDLYERGTAAEFDFNYGRSSLEPGGGWHWGAMASWTRPTLGNHEGFNIATWRDYWHGIPDWETFVFGGVRFLNLNSECTRIGGCGTNSAQYRFVQEVLASNTHACVVAYWHKPVLSAVSDTTAMNPIWALLADNGGDLVLNGHTHTMQRFHPMNANLQTGRPDSHMVELISGAGTHHLTPTVDTDPRSAWQVNRVAGVAYLTLAGGGSGNATAIQWHFRNQNGALISGSESSVSCGTDGVPPTPPGKPSGSSNAPGTIDLTWAASTDDQATSLTYNVFRDGGTTPVGSVTSSSTATVAFTDTGLMGGSTHTYEVEASDGVNGSGRSAPSDPITVLAGPAPVFQDGFGSGLGAWINVNNLALDSVSFPPGSSPPSVRGSVASARAYAEHDMSASYPSLCLSAAVNVTSSTGSVALLKLRTAGGQSIGRVFIDSGRVLKVRGDISGSVFSSGVVLPTGWSTLGLCGTVGSTGTFTLALNGSPLGTWTTNNGTTQIGRIQIGDDLAKTWTVNYDDVIVTA